MPENKAQHVGIKIRKLREESRLSLTELSQRSGVSRGYLHLIEKGESSPTQEKLLAIAGALGVSVSELMGASDLPAVPESLKEFADEKGLPVGDIIMLSRINYRGQRPKTKEEWKLLYNVIKGIIDQE
ncbi:MAG: helix-turn-helix domain-containing protein [Anaerolineae bacterium]|nr:helix-turn-helix domain-containing protein [Anaerolineae bacterium]